MDAQSKKYLNQRTAVLQLLWAIILSIFFVEFIIMLALEYFFEDRPPLFIGLLDSVILISILFPLLYFFVFQRIFLQYSEGLREARIVQEQRYTAIRLMVVVIITIFTLETGIMLVFFYAFPQIHPLLKSFIDSILLSVVLFPLLYIMVLQPLMQYLLEKGQAEESLKESEERFRSLAESASDGIILIDPEGKITYWNKGAEKIFGYAKEETLNKPAHELLAPDRYQTEYERGFGFFKKTGDGSMIGNLAELMARNKDGTEFPVELSVSAMKFKEGWGALGIVRDISERKKVEEALKVSKESLARAQALAKIGNWDWNIDQNTLHWSDEIYRIFGVLPREFSATFESFMQFVHPEDRESLKQAVDKAVKENESYSIDHRIVRPDGTVRVVHEQADLIFDEIGNAIHMVGTIQDLTERKEMEEELAKSHLEEEKLKAIQTLSMTYAHNILNTLTPLQGFAELLLKSLDPADPRYKWCKTIVDNSKKVTEIVNKLQEIETYSPTQLGGVEILEIEQKKKIEH